MANTFADHATVVRHLENRLLVADLKEILKDLHLSVSGNKRPLIDRIANHLQLLKSTHDVTRYTSLKHKILSVGGGQIHYPSYTSTHGSANNTNHPRVPSQTGLTYPYGELDLDGRVRPPQQQNVHQQILNIRPSPFYDVAERLSTVATLPFSSRNTVSLSFICSTNSLDKLQQQNSDYSVALMCADSTFAYNPNRELLMEFPSPAEILVNARKLHANIKGMKNKPGTVPPPDITSLVEKIPRLANRVEITYTNAMNVHKRFGLQVVLLQKFSVEALVERIKNGSRFTRDSVLAKFRQSEDDDIEMASFDLTLKDPLSYVRIKVPCRSTFCKHNQCWDAGAFLQINEQTPQWKCPICHIFISSLGSIAVDMYFQDILDMVEENVDTILVGPQGNWSVPGESSATHKHIGNAQDSSDSRGQIVLDVGEIEEEEGIFTKNEQVTPTLATTPSVKRKAMPVCIDLTEDSDDELEPAKRTKLSETRDIQIRASESVNGYLPSPSIPPSVTHTASHLTSQEQMPSNGIDRADVLLPSTSEGRNGTDAVDDLLTRPPATRAAFVEEVEATNHEAHDHVSRDLQTAEVTENREANTHASSNRSPEPETSPRDPDRFAFLERQMHFPHITSSPSEHSTPQPNPQEPPARTDNSQSFEPYPILGAVHTSSEEDEYEHEIEEEEELVPSRRVVYPYPENLSSPELSEHEVPPEFFDEGSSDYSSWSL